MLVPTEQQALSRCRDLSERVAMAGGKPRRCNKSDPKILAVLDTERLRVLWIFNGRPLRGVELPRVGHALELVNAARYQGWA